MLTRSWLRLRQRALNDANQKLAEAEATLASATTNRGEAEKAVETAKANVATAKSNLDQANNDLTEANKAKDVAKNRLADATAAIDSAQKAVEAAQAKINEGALGFYESMAESDPIGSQRAISMLNKAATTDKLADNLKTKIGAEGDASLISLSSAIRCMSLTITIRVCLIGALQTLRWRLRRCTQMPKRMGLGI